MATQNQLECLLERPITYRHGREGEPMPATLRLRDRTRGSYVAHIGPDREIPFNCASVTIDGDVITNTVAGT